MQGLVIKFDATKLDALVHDMASAESTIKTDMEVAMMASLFRVHSFAVRPGYVPKKTGTLARSLSFKIAASRKGEVMGAVGSNLSYARIHELGGDTGRGRKTHIVGKHYIGRAVEDNRDYVVEQFKKIQVIKKLKK